MSDTSSRRTRALVLTAAISVSALWVILRQQDNASFSAILTSKRTKLLRGSLTGSTMVQDTPQKFNGERYSPKELHVVRPARREEGRQLTTKIQGFSGEPDPWLFPLQECQGDCDRDSDVGNCVFLLLGYWVVCWILKVLSMCILRFTYFLIFAVR